MVTFLPYVFLFLFRIFHEAVHNPWTLDIFFHTTLLRLCLYFEKMDVLYPFAHFPKYI